MNPTKPAMLLPQQTEGHGRQEKLHTLPAFFYYRHQLHTDVPMSILYHQLAQSFITTGISSTA